MLDVSVFCHACPRIEFHKSGGANKNIIYFIQYLKAITSCKIPPQEGSNSALQKRGSTPTVSPHSKRQKPPVQAHYRLIRTQLIRVFTQLRRLPIPLSLWRRPSFMHMSRPKHCRFARVVPAQNPTQWVQARALPTPGPPARRNAPFNWRKEREILAELTNSDKFHRKCLFSHKTRLELMPPNPDICFNASQIRAAP